MGAGRRVARRRPLAPATPRDRLAADGTRKPVMSFWCISRYGDTLTLGSQPGSIMAMARTLRLDADQDEVLRELARIDGIPVSDEIRHAIAAHIDSRRKDGVFQARLRASLERHRQLVETLADR